MHPLPRVALRYSLPRVCHSARPLVASRGLSRKTNPALAVHATAQTESYRPEFVPKTPSALPITSNWRTLEDQPLTRESVRGLLNNAIPTIRHKAFLSKEECSRTVEIIQEHQVVSPVSLAAELNSG